MAFGNKTHSRSVPIKKRKSRQASPLVLKLFFSVFLLSGLGFLSFYAYKGYRDIRMFSVYEEATCTIVS